METPEERRLLDRVSGVLIMLLVEWLDKELSWRLLSADELATISAPTDWWFCWIVLPALCGSFTEPDGLFVERRRGDELSADQWEEFEALGLALDDEDEADETDA